MPPKVDVKKITCTVSVNPTKWKLFRDLCVRDGISASFCFETFIDTFLKSMKVGDDLPAELSKMLILYSDHKLDNYRVPSVKRGKTDRG